MANATMRNLAMDAVSLSPLMNNRTPLKTEEILGVRLTITAFDFVSYEQGGFEKSYPVINFREYPDRYYSGGTVLSKICRMWENACGDAEIASQQLAAEGGVAVVIKETRTKNGNNLVSVTVL